LQTNRKDGIGEEQERVSVSETLDGKTRMQGTGLGSASHLPLSLFCPGLHPESLGKGKDEVREVLRSQAGDCAPDGDHREPVKDFSMGRSDQIYILEGLLTIVYTRVAYCV
jgi:hypothetical protein